MDDEAWSYELRLDPQMWMVGLVRDSLTAALRRNGIAELADTAALLVSEVVTNGITHSEQPVLVGTRWRNQVLRVTVHDDSLASPKLRAPSDEEEGGRGLLLEAACATAWGVHACAGGRPGKDVWFELS